MRAVLGPGVMGVCCTYRVDSLHCRTFFVNGEMNADRIITVADVDNPDNKFTIRTPPEGGYYRDETIPINLLDSRNNSNV